MRAKGCATTAARWVTWSAAWPSLTVDAIERGKGDEAERLARAHAALAVRNFEAVLESGGLERLPGSALISVQGD